jgi:hypothetical protein
MDQEPSHVSLHVGKGRGTGRLRITEAVRELIVRMAHENPRWGYFRIRGELLKVGYMVSATTVRSVLRRNHVPPAGRRSQMSWRQFLTAHAESLVATDFFTVDTVFFKRLYVLFVVHLATRRVVAAACTAEPQFGLGDPAGSQSELEAERRRHQRSGRRSRPRSKVRPKL